MNTHGNDIDDLIGKHLAGEASAEENVLVEQWCAQSSQNQQYYQHLRTIFEKAALVQDTTHYDADLAWQKVQAQLHAKKKVWFHQPVFRIAASLLLLSVIGFWAYQFTGTNTLALASAESVVTDSLPDGTTVVLNKQSELSVVYSARTKKGRITLTGEASFNINSEASKEFIVEADEVLIRDIGTVFNVMAYPQSNTIEVTVTEGEVQFYTQTSTGVFIKAGGKGVYNKLSKSFSVLEADTNVLAYQTRQFVFEEEELQRVVDQINAIYDKKLRIDDNLKPCLVTVNFNNEEIDTIAEILAETLNLKMTISDAEITLEGEGCE